MKRARSERSLREGVRNVRKKRNSRCSGVSGSPSLEDPVAKETEEQRLEREQNERYVLEAMGDCAAGMSVENVPAVVNIRTLKGRFIAHKLSAG